MHTPHTLQRRSSSTAGRRLGVPLLAAAIAAFAASAAQAHRPPPLESQATLTSTREQAQAAYERNHWPEAFAAFVRLAEAGDPEGQRIVLLMLRHGPLLYGMRFELSAEQRARWVAPSTAR